MSERARNTVSTPSPPRVLPAPPESAMRAQLSTTSGNFASVCSLGLLCVSPSLMQTVAEMPSSFSLAPQPPPKGPVEAMKNWRKRRSMPWKFEITRSAWWPAMTRPGMAGAKALNTVSITVIG